MSVILIVLGLVWGSYTYDPMIYDNGPYVQDVQKTEYTTLEECKINTHGTGDLCVGDNPSMRYVMDKSVVQKTVSGATLNYTTCSYWAGCYFRDDN